MASELRRVPPQVRAAVGNLETLRRRVRRQRRGLRPPEPATLDQLVIPDHLKTTGDAQPLPFLTYDSGPTAAKRMLVYGSQEQLRHLSNADR